MSIANARAVFVNLGIDSFDSGGSRFKKDLLASELMQARLKVSSSGISKLYRRGEEVTKNEPEGIQIIISS